MADTKRFSILLACIGTVVAITMVTVLVGCISAYKRDAEIDIHTANRLDNIGILAERYKKEKRQLPRTFDDIKSFREYAFTLSVFTDIDPAKHQYKFIDDYS